MSKPQGPQGRTEQKITKSGIRALAAAAAALFVVPVVLGGLLFGMYYAGAFAAGDAAGGGDGTRHEMTPVAAILSVRADIEAEDQSQGEAWQEGLDQLPKAKSRPEGIGGYTPSGAVLAALDERIAKARADGCDVGFVMLDLKSGQGIVYNTGRVFYGASSIKFHRLMAIALEDPSIAAAYPKMISDILRYSDNDAYTYICRRYPDDALDRYAAEAGASLKYTSSKRYASFDTASLTRMWLYAYALIKENKTCAKIASYAGNPDVSAIRDVLGGEYETVSKAGWYDESAYAATVDGGIIYDKESPYLLVIMSDYTSAFGRLHPFVETLEKAHQEIKKQL